MSRLTHGARELARWQGYFRGGVFDDRFQSVGEDGERMGGWLHMGGSSGGDGFPWVFVAFGGMSSGIGWLVVDVDADIDVDADSGERL